MNDATRPSTSPNGGAMGPTSQRVGESTWRRRATGSRAPALLLADTPAGAATPFFTATTLTLSTDRCSGTAADAVTVREFAR
jgi:hypothetical protein